MATHFVPTEEIQRLTLGSYEHLASKLDEAVSKDAARIFGGNTPNKIERIGTFPDSVLLAADDGRFAKVKYSKSPSGSVKLLAVESVKVSLYTESNINNYLMREARSVVDSILAHDEAQAGNRMRALLPFLEEQVELTESELVDSILSTIQAPRPWKRVYFDRSAQIHEFLGESLKQIAAKKLQPKFESLLKGLDASASEKYREIAVADLKYMSEAIASWIQSAEVTEALKESFGSTKASMSEEDVALMTTFLAFSEDLHQDLSSISSALAESVAKTNSVAGLGRLYDTLAPHAFDFEVASRFASAMIAGLQQS